MIINLTHDKMEQILNEIQRERKRQNKKWGEQNHNPVEWISILVEEVGEASKQALDYYFQNPHKIKEGQEAVDFESVQRSRLSAYREELVQVAAVAVQMLECHDRINGIHPSERDHDNDAQRYMSDQEAIDNLF